MVIRADEQGVLGKKNATGVVIVKTKQAFVLGFHNDKQQIGNTNKEVQKIADYLIEQGY
jgi:profilin